jgi:hypothetical protein
MKQPKHECPIYFMSIVVDNVVIVIAIRASNIIISNLLSYISSVMKFLASLIKTYVHQQ